MRLVHRSDNMRVHRRLSRLYIALQGITHISNNRIISKWCCYSKFLSYFVCSLCLSLYFIYL